MKNEEATSPFSGQELLAAGAARVATDSVTPSPPSGATSSFLKICMRVNGDEHDLSLDSRATLLDTLREQLSLTGTKKGCNRGECGACTVHLDGKRVNSCLVFSASCDGRDVITIEGLSNGEELHPVQQAFIDHDGFQCGFCTPGQIMSAVACIREGHTKTDEEIREWMSGNICRCAAYPQIVNAVRAASGRTT